MLPKLRIFLLTVRIKILFETEDHFKNIFRFMYNTLLYQYIYIFGNKEHRVSIYMRPGVSCDHKLDLMFYDGILIIF